MGFGEIPYMHLCVVTVCLSHAASPAQVGLLQPRRSVLLHRSHRPRAHHGLPRLYSRIQNPIPALGITQRNPSQRGARTAVLLVLCGGSEAGKKSAFTEPARGSKSQQSALAWSDGRARQGLVRHGPHYGRVCTSSARAWLHETAWQGLDMSVSLATNEAMWCTRLYTTWHLVILSASHEPHVEQTE